MRPKDFKACAWGFIIPATQLTAFAGTAAVSAASALPAATASLAHWAARPGNAAKAAAWLLGLTVCAWVGLGTAFCTASAVAFLFLGGCATGVRRPVELSAYSVFNEGFKELIGTFSAATLERELRRDPHWRACDDGDDVADSDSDKDDEGAQAPPPTCGDGGAGAGPRPRRARKKAQGLRRRAVQQQQGRGPINRGLGKGELGEWEAWEDGVGGSDWEVEPRWEEWPVHDAD